MAKAFDLINDSNSKVSELHEGRREQRKRCCGKHPLLAGVITEAIAPLINYLCHRITDADGERYQLNRCSFCIIESSYIPKLRGVSI